MDFDAFLDQAWADHAAQPAAVAERLATQGLALLQQESQVGALASLALHVQGQHLGHWQAGAQFQQQLAALPLLAGGSSTAQTLQRFATVLAWAGGGPDPRGTLPSSGAARITAMAAMALTEHDSTRARSLLDEATAAVQAAALSDTDPAVRALAVAGNNMAGTLEDLPTRSAAQRALMILAAQTGRHFWAKAGGWLETERAEYRLARTWLKAGDAQLALQHARLCLDIVQAHGDVPLEHFFGLEALALAQHAAGDTAGLAVTVAAAARAFAALDESDQGWCRAALNTVQDLPLAT